MVLLRRCFVLLLLVTSLHLALCRKAPSNQLNFKYGLRDETILVWDGIISKKSQPSTLQFFTSGSQKTRVGRLLIKGVRKRIEVRMGGDEIFAGCYFGNKEVAPSKKFNIIITVNGTTLNVYLNRQKRLEMPLHLVNSSPERIGSARLYGSHTTNSFNLLEGEELRNAVQEESRCGIPLASRHGPIAVPDFCPPIESGCRIVGGTEAKPGSSPWQAAIRLQERGASTSGRHICGATLISRNLAITAGHCFASTSTISLRDYVVRVGDYNNRDGIPTSQVFDVEISQDISIKRVIRHPNYRGTSPPVHDVALIELQEPAEYNRFVQPACLPTTDSQFPDGTRCGITGWGGTEFGQDVSKYPKCLQKASVIIKSISECAHLYRNHSFNRERMMCAADHCVDSCQGDSGGPLICSEPHQGHSRFVLWGVTSWGIGCGERDKPGVYTRLSKYMSWMFKAFHLNNTIPSSGGSGVRCNFAFSRS